MEVGSIYRENDPLGEGFGNREELGLGLCACSVLTCVYEPVGGTGQEVGIWEKVQKLSGSPGQMLLEGKFREGAATLAHQPSLWWLELCVPSPEVKPVGPPDLGLEGPKLQSCKVFVFRGFSLQW